MTSDDRHAKALALLKTSPVIPVLTIEKAAGAAPLARALLAGGLRVLEVTLRTAAALEAIRTLRDAVPGAIIGAGTITEPSQIDAALKAGAQFLISPGTTPALIDAIAASPVPFMPGVATVSEAMRLRERGIRTMKLFPAEAVGGTKLLAGIFAPLPDLVFCPTGGIDLERARLYLSLPNVACVGGSWMVPKAAIDMGDWDAIQRLATKAAALRA